LGQGLGPWYYFQINIEWYNKDRAKRFKQAYSKYSPEDVLKMVFTKQAICN